jgi:phosphohistidine phosphatase SixA
MIIYFVRHASAGQKKATPKKDEKRPLDAEGVHQCTQMGRILSAMEVTVDAVISSPLKRATQTAALVANEIGYEGKLHWLLTPRLAKASADAGVNENSKSQAALSQNGAGGELDIPAEYVRQKSTNKKQAQADLTTKSRPKTSRK